MQVFIANEELLSPYDDMMVANEVKIYSKLVERKESSLTAHKNHHKYCEEVNEHMEVEV